MKNKAYICPMHPEVTSNKPGRCPKCGMDLVAKHNGIQPTMSHEENKGLGKVTLKSYMPLVVIIGLILVTALVISWRDMQMGEFRLSQLISHFMTGFFLVFSGFKLMDLKGFAHGYYTYDLLAKKWLGYGYIYPFIELFFGLSMILMPQAKWLLMAELIIMTFSGLGVAIKLLKRERFACACLGTFLKIPLTKVTLIEDFGMAALALVLLLI